MLELSLAELSAESANLLPVAKTALTEPTSPGSVLDMTDDESAEETPPKRKRSPDSRKTISEVLHDIYDTNIQ